MTLGKNYDASATVTLNSTKTFLNPGESVTYYATGYFPYTTTFYEGTVQLKTKQAENPDQSKSSLISTIPKLHFIDTNLTVDEIAADKTYEIGEVGNRNSIKLVETTSYRSANGNILATRIEVKNLERRGTKVPTFVGSFKASDGSIYPASTGEIAENNFPNGSSIVTLWAEIPQELKQEAYNF